MFRKTYLGCQIIKKRKSKAVITIKVRRVLPLKGTEFVLGNKECGEPLGESGSLQCSFIFIFIFFLVCFFGFGVFVC